MRLLHVMIREVDLDTSIPFYCDVFTMTLLRKKDTPSGKFTLVLIGYGNKEDNTVIELTHHLGEHQYALGNSFGYFSIGVPDVVRACVDINYKDIKIVRAPDPMHYSNILHCLCRIS